MLESRWAHYTEQSMVERTVPIVFAVLYAAVLVTSLIWELL